MQDSIFTMPTLPTELIVEILSRLPVKSLLKFRCVSKSWRSLISSPQFVKTHLSASAKNKDYAHHRLVLTEIRSVFTSHDIQYILRDCSVRSLRNDSVIEALDLNYPMNKPNLSVSVVGSVNGLICLAIKGNDLVLWNPSIRVYRKLPDSGLKLSHGSQINRATSVIYGFGYDESSDDYKIVGACCSRYHFFHHPEVKIYSVKSNSWRSKDGIPDGMQLTEPCRFLNGKLHWTGELINGGFLKGRDIISLDLADENWGKLEQPLYANRSFFAKLEVLGSYLSVFCKYNITYADMWIMKEYGVKESWTKMYTIKYSSPFHDWYSFIYQTLCMSNKGDILFVPRSNLIVHNTEDKPIIYPKITNFGFCVAVNIYIESLVCAPLLGTNKA